MREPIFSLTRKDFKVETMRGSGKGGQKRNKTESKVRITHIETGISASSDDDRDQRKNRKIAFKRLCADRRFKAWLSQKTLRSIDIQREVEQDMSPDNIKIEVRRGNMWVDDKCLSD